jgi:hypothetical protein
MRENVKKTKCCCVLVSEDGENWCDQHTSGPDEPFCRICVGRHHNEIRVLSGYVKVTQRLREVSS